MKTKRTLSNISYNTPAFFSGAIQALYKARKIDWCYWIVHKPDLDEQKPHIHFVLHPSKSVDTFELWEFFREYDPEKPDKPRGVLTKWYYTNSLDDWLLYVVHDIGYLASKGQRREVHYQFSDLQSTDPDSLRNDWNSIDRTKSDRLRYLAEAAQDGTPFAVLVQSGFIPIAQRAQYEWQYNALVQMQAAAASGRFQPHDPDTGEVIDQTEPTEENGAG